MEQAVRAEAIPHRVGEAGQFDARDAHDADPAKPESFGKIEDDAAVDQRGESVVGGKFRSIGLKRIGRPSRRDLAPDDALTGVGLEPIDSAGFVRQALPDRQQKP